MEKVDRIVECNFNGKNYPIKIRSAVDKTTMICYHTFYFDNDNFIVITTNEGEQWKINGARFGDNFAEMLGKIVEDIPL